MERYSFPDYTPKAIPIPWPPLKTVPIEALRYE